LDFFDSTVLQLSHGCLSRQPWPRLSLHCRPLGGRARNDSTMLPPPAAVGMPDACGRSDSVDALGTPRGRVAIARGGSDRAHCGPRALAGGGERSQEEGAIAGGGEQSLVEGSDHLWRGAIARRGSDRGRRGAIARRGPWRGPGAIAGGGERSQVGGSNRRFHRRLRCCCRRRHGRGGVGGGR
jgi:hypothetical protein